MKTLYGDKFFKRRVKKYHEKEIQYGCIFSRAFLPDAVIDVGCALGSYLIPFKRLGCTTIGFDKYFDYAKPYCDKEIVGCLTTHDASKPYPNKNKVDLVMCIEVAEHLPETEATILVSNLCSLSKKYILFTAARVGQRGTGHINCQPPEYWCDMFEHHNFVFDLQKTGETQEEIIGISDPLRLIKNIIVLHKQY